MYFTAQITDDVRLCATDPKNFTIETRRIVQDGPNKGKEQWDIAGYHGTIKSAAISLLTRHMDLIAGATSAIKDLKTLINAVDEGADLIARACEKIVVPVPSNRQPVTEASQ